MLFLPTLIGMNVKTHFVGPRWVPIHLLDDSRGPASVPRLPRSVICGFAFQMHAARCASGNGNSMMSEDSEVLE